jgi:hypothetical protein
LPWVAGRVKAVVGEDVGDGREAVVGLCGGDVVDVARLAEAAGSVLGVSCEGVLAGSEASEGLVHGRGLDHAVVGELGG